MNTADLDWRYYIPETITNKIGRMDSAELGGEVGVATCGVQGATLMNYFMFFADSSDLTVGPTAFHEVTIDMSTQGNTAADCLDIHMDGGDLTQIRVHLLTDRLNRRVWELRYTYDGTTATADYIQGSSGGISYMNSWIALDNGMVSFNKHLYMMPMFTNLGTPKQAIGYHAISNEVAAWGYTGPV